MVITFTLQSIYSGATYVAGPFDISGTTSGGVTTLLGDNISKASLLTGVTISDIDDATTGGTIQSVDGTCSNSIQWLVTGNEPTPTPTPIPEGDVIYEFEKCTTEGSLMIIDVSTTMIVNAGGPSGTPSIGDTISLSGSINADAVWEFRGSLSANEPSAVTIVGYNIATCSTPA